MDIQDENGKKMINEYVRECRIGSGSYGKVVSTFLNDAMCQLFLFRGIDL